MSTHKTIEPIDVCLDEVLTSDSCVKLIVELIKYILYQKQQIPLAYDSLAQWQARVNLNGNRTSRSSSSITGVMSSLKSISDHLSSQFLTEGCRVKEIAIIIGATIVSPKLYIKVELPSYVLNSQTHLECQHSSRKPLLKLMRSVTECSAFQDAIVLPLNPTNTFIFILQTNNSESGSQFFMPKPQFQLSQSFINSCYHIKLHYSNHIETNCTCSSLVSVYRDQISCIKNDPSVQFLECHQIDLSCYQWYQAKAVIKGFKFTS